MFFGFVQIMIVAGITAISIAFSLKDKEMKLSRKAIAFYCIGTALMLFSFAGILKIVVEMRGL